jgi:hypothetical protein
MLTGTGMAGGVIEAGTVAGIEAGLVGGVGAVASSSDRPSSIGHHHESTTIRHRRITMFHRQLTTVGRATIQDTNLQFAVHCGLISSVWGDCRKRSSDTPAAACCV